MMESVELVLMETTSLEKSTLVLMAHTTRYLGFPTIVGYRMGTYINRFPMDVCTKVSFTSPGRFPLVRREIFGKSFLVDLIFSAGLIPVEDRATLLSCWFHIILL